MTSLVNVRMEDRNATPQGDLEQNFQFNVTIGENRMGYITFLKFQIVDFPAHFLDFPYGVVFDCP